MNKKVSKEEVRKIVEGAFAPTVRPSETLPASFYGLAANGAYEALHNWLEKAERAGEKCGRGKDVLEEVKAAKRLLSGLVIVNSWKEMTMKEGRLPEGDSFEVIGVLSRIARDAEALGFRWDRMEVY